MKKLLIPLIGAGSLLLVLNAPAPPPPIGGVISPGAGNTSNSVVQIATNAVRVEAGANIGVSSAVNASGGVTYTVSTQGGAAATNAIGNLNGIGTNTTILSSNKIGLIVRDGLSVTNTGTGGSVTITNGSEILSGNITANTINGVSVITTNITATGIATGIFTNYTTNFVYIAPWGNDTNGTGSIENPFKTPWDLYNDNGDLVGGPAVVGGAITKSKPFQTLVAMPGTHLWGACPLSVTNNLNLWIQPGAIVLRINFPNSTTPNLAADLLSCGPFIQPSDGSVIRNDGVVIATNSAGNYNAAFGWLEGLEMRSSFSTDYGWENRAATNVSVSGAGKWISTTDVMYMVQTNTALKDMQVSGGIYRSGWDSFRANGNFKLTTTFMDIFSTNRNSDPMFNSSRGVAVSGGVKWTDTASFISSGGGTNQNYPVDADGATTIVTLNGSTLLRTTNTGSDVHTGNSATVQGNYFTSNTLTTTLNAPYSAAWNGSSQVPTKDAVYDKIETLSGGGGTNRWYLPGGDPTQVYIAAGQLPNLNPPIAPSHMFVMSNNPHYFLLDSLANVTISGSLIVPNIGGSSGDFVTVDINGQFFKQSGIALTDISGLATDISITAVGTAATIGTGMATLDFGTTDPITQAPDSGGVYFFTARAELKYNNATFAAGRTVTIQVISTDSSTVQDSSVITIRTINGVTDHAATAVLHGIYTANSSSDTLQLQAQLSNASGGGSLDATSAKITAYRIR